MRATSLTPSATPIFGVENNNRGIKNNPANSSPTGQAGNSKKYNYSALIADDADAVYANLESILGEFASPLQALGWSIIQEAVKGARKEQDHDDGVFLLHPEGGLQEHLETYGLRMEAWVIQRLAERLYSPEQIEEIMAVELSGVVAAIPEVPVKKAVPVPVPVIKIKSPAVPVTGNIVTFPVNGKNSAGLQDIPASSDYSDFLAGYIFAPTSTPPKKSNKYVRINHRRYKGDLKGQMHFPFLAQMELEETALAA